MENIKEKIGAININKYRIKGGLSMFNRENPKLIDVVNEITKDMQVCCINKTLYPKLLFIKKYGCDINKIKRNGKIMVFDRSVGDFIVKSDNSAKFFWKEKKDEINKITEYYTKEKTIDLLKNKYKKYLGKSGNRKLMRDDVKLFSSVYYHTKYMDGFSNQQKKFSQRLYILVNKINIFCEKHKQIKGWKFIDGEFKINCNKCRPKYPSIDWFKNKYGKDWEVHKKKQLKKIKSCKTNSLDWHINKYGERGKLIYKKRYVEHINKMSKLKKNRYSKISQDLFWKIYKNHNDKNGVYFYELNQEYVLKIPEYLNYDKNVMILDFKYKNKIIEYNGIYWHNEIEDKIRYDVLRKMGFNVLVITSDDYNKNKKPEEIIKKCNEFLLC